jgi:hypothetical protein
VSQPSAAGGSELVVTVTVTEEAVVEIIDGGGPKRFRQLQTLFVGQTWDQDSGYKLYFIRRDFQSRVFSGICGNLTYKLYFATTIIITL